MNAVLRDAFRLKIQSLTGNPFQDFVDELYVLSFGSDYAPVRQKKDKGCDGILNGDTILAVYAPEKYLLREFKKKYSDDFSGYQANWKSKYPNWRVVYNGEIQANAIEFLKEMKADVEVNQIDHIFHQISRLNSTKQRSLASYLGIDEQFFVNDALEEIIEDLSNEKNDGPIAYLKPMYIPEKISLNFEDQDADTILSEYEVYLPYFENLSGIMAINEDRVTNLKSKVCRDYLSYNGSCKERLTNMTDVYAGKRKGDDLYKKMIRVVLVYFFEQCLIGKKTTKE